MSLEPMRFSILVECRKCGSSIPINGLTPSLLCANCSQVMRVAEPHWLRLIGDFIRDDLRARKGGCSNSEVLAPWGKFSVEHGHSDPICPHCDQPLPAAAWQPLNEPLFCPHCGKQIPLRRPPEWFAAVQPGARWLLGETFEVAAEKETEQEPVSIHCINCGASLAIDGSARTVVCKYCNSDNYLPDQLWLRLHPASIRKPWSILFDLGPAGYGLPDEIEYFCDVAHAPDGGLIAAFIEEEPDEEDYDEEEEEDEDEDEDEQEEDEEREDGGRPTRARLIKFDPQGLVAWVRRDIDFDDEARLECTPDGQTLALVLSGGKGFVFIDPQTGRSLGRLDCPDTTGEQEDQPPEKRRPMQLYNAEGVALAPDGTLVLLRNGPADAEPVFTRYTREGRPLPMWPEEPEEEGQAEQPAECEPVAPQSDSGGVGDFFRRLFGGGRPQPAPAAPEPQAIEPADWDALPDRLLVPPRDVAFTFSPGGDLILVSRERDRLAHYDPSGKLVETHRLVGLPEEVNDWGPIGADELENVYLAYLPDQYWESGGGLHLLRVPLGGQPEIYRGWHVDPECPLGDSGGQMKVRTDGSLYLGDDLDNLRVVSPEGRLVFRTPATVELDAVDCQRYRQHNRKK